MCETGSSTCKTTSAAVTLTAGYLSWAELSITRMQCAALCCKVSEWKQAASLVQAANQNHRLMLNLQPFSRTYFLSYHSVFLQDTRLAVPLGNVPAPDAAVGWDVWRLSPSTSPSFRDIAVERWEPTLHPFIWWVYLWAFCFPSGSFTLD